MRESIAIPATQARSQQTVDAILDAAESLLRQGGLQACVVPDVAKAARRGVGSVYRRCGDKEQLLKAVLRRYAARLPAANALGAKTLKRRAASLEDAVPLVIKGIVAGRRRDWRIVAALTEAARDSGDAA